MFTITVTNDGTEDLENVVVEDELAPACGLTQDEATAKIQAIGNGDAIFNVGESFEYECTDEGVTSAYENEATVTATGVDSDLPVTDTDTSPVLIPVVTTPSIAIDKIDANDGDRDGNTGNDTQTINRGNDAVFTITVTNNGTEDLENVVVEDELALACELTQDEATVKIQAIGNGDAIFNVGESFEYECTDEDVTSAYTNSATVTAV